MSTTSLTDYYADITLLIIFLTYGNLGYFQLSMLPTVLLPYLDYMFGLQSHTKSLESNKALFTLMGSHIHESENSINMSFKDITSLKSRRLRKLLDLLLPLTSHSLLILHFPVNAYLVQSMTFQLNGLIESIIPWYNLYDFYISTFDISNVNYIHYQLLTRPHTWVNGS